MLFRQMTFAAIAALTCLFVANDAMAQRGGFGGRGNSKIEFLQNSQVQEELGLLEEQVEDLKEVQDEARNVMRNAFSGMREKFQDLSREERDELMTEIREKIQEDMKEVDSKANDFLLPHQTERLDQLMLQSQMRRGGGIAGALGSPAMLEKLGVSESEFKEMAEKLKEKEEEVKAELEEKMKKLRSEAQDDILSVLPSDVQAKVKSMIGEAFELNRGRGGAGRGGAGRGGADRGGRGGRGGGGGGGRGGRGGDRGGDRGRF